jgi:virulence factor Mce-like protein
MKRILLSACLLLAIGGFVFVNTGATNPKNTDPTYKIELDNAFGLVNGAAFKVAGINAGTISSIDLDQKTLHAVVTVDITTPGLGDFHSDATCQTRPQSLIGEYFVSCDPGHNGGTLASGSTIPVTHTQSTIPADLLLNIMRLPQRERLTLIINELGAAVAGRSSDLQAALRRAVPALTQTDNLLSLLADDSSTIEQLTANSNTVITALANNSKQVTRFIDEAGNAAAATASQDANLRATLQKLPPFLEQLRPAMARLGEATDANLPVLQNLNAASGQLNRFITDLPPFARASLPALRSLGKASVTGKTAVEAAKPTIKHLNQFAAPTPELAKNLSIVLPHLDDRRYATEPNPRSPGGKGYTGLEALLQFVFNLAEATNTYGPFGHQLAVDGFVSTMCTPYATPATIAQNLALNGAAYRSCYAWLGPNQPGVNTTDPSNPSACVPDPGGSMPGKPGPATGACKLAAQTHTVPARRRRTSSRKHAAPKPGTAPNPAPSPGAGGGGSSGGSGGGVAQTLSNVGQTINKVLSLLGGGGSASNASGTSTTPSGSSSSGAGGSSGSGGANNVSQLLNYLLAP